MTRRTEPVFRFNPAFLSPEGAAEQFVARFAELDLLLQALHDSERGPARHTLVVGPRGIGKTTLVHRASLEMERREELAGRWYPIPMAEESYAVGSPGQFWLEVLFHLGRRTAEDRWRTVHSELAQEPSETLLRERALAQLLDFADRQGRRLVIIVENLQQLLGDQLSPDDAWVLRHTLLNEHRILLLGTATARFAAIDDPAKALYGLFNVIQLAPLEDEGCARLWTRLTGRTPDEARVRAVRILTGGNPRLVAMLSSISEGHSLSDLGRDLDTLVDQHTEYFKSHLDALPAGERAVYVALTELWRPATSREVAQAARQDVNKTSAFLRRLVERGVVRIVRTEGRNNWYEVLERLYSIFYLLRRSGGRADRVKALIRFLVEFDGDERLVSRAREVAEEGLTHVAGDLGASVLTYRRLLDAVPHLRERILAATPPEFLMTMRQWESARTDSGFQVAEALLHAGLKAGRSPDGEAILRETVQRFPDSAAAWTRLGEVLSRSPEMLDEALECFHRALGLHSEHRPAWEGLERSSAALGMLAMRALALVRLERWQEALQVLETHLVAQPPEKKVVREAIDACLGLAAAGFGRDLLSSLESTRRAQRFEPVVTGIQIYLGQPPIASQELLEAGQEVAERIRVTSLRHGRIGKP